MRVRNGGLKSHKCVAVYLDIDQQHTLIRTLFTGKLLNTLLSGLSDRSAAVRKAYAKAIGHLIKVRVCDMSVDFTALVAIVTDMLMSC